VRSKPAPAIKDYVERNMLSFQPIIDNVTTAANIRERRLAGSIAKVPILTGTNADEGTVFTIRAYPTRQDLLDAFFGFSPELQQAIIALYPMGSPGIETDADFNAAVFRDLVFTCVC
jgi:carboxylesterase type B